MPDHVLGTADGAYQLFTPTEVVEAGGGASGALPEPPSTGKAVPESTAGVIAWQTLEILLEEELYTSLRNLSTGTILRIGSLDPGTERATIAGIAPSEVVTSGLPATTGNIGNCLKVVSGGLAWGTCGGSGLPPYTAAAEAFLRAAGSSRTWSAGHLAPRYTTTNKDDCLRVNQLGSGISWRDCPTGGTGGATAFTGLSDTPSAYPAGNGGQYVRVNSQSNGLFFASPPRSVPTPPNTDGQLMTSVNGTLIWQDLLGSINPTPNVADQGKFVRVTGDVTKDPTELVYDDPHAAVLAGLPALTGHGGSVLTVVAAETGVEWKKVAGGGDSGGGTGWTDVVTGNWGVDGGYLRNRKGSLNATQVAAVIAAYNDPATVFIALRTSSNTGQTFGFAWPTSGRNLTTGANQRNDFASVALPSSYYDTADRAVYAGNVTMGIFLSGSDPRVYLVDPDQLPAYAYPEWRISVFKPSGGGGSDGPSIPKPTPAGKLKHLRVDAAGAAYELADAPQPSDSTPAPVAAHGVPGTSAAYARGDHGHADAASQPLAYRQVDSVDVRTGQAAYGFWLPAGSSGNLALSGGDGDPYHPWTVYINDGTYTPLGYDPARPGLLLDGDTGKFNANGIDFTAATAGSTDRTINVIIQVQPANHRRYTTADGITVTMDGKGRTTDDGTEKQIASQTIHMDGSDHQGPLYFTFAVTYSAAPRAGENDMVWFGIAQAGTGRQISVTASGSRMRQGLNALGPRPIQKTVIEGSSTFFPAAADIPAGVDLGSTPTLYFHQFTNSPGFADTSGKNEPAETDHSDWLKRESGSTVLGYEAAQDLSSLHITAAHGAGAVDHTGGSVYLVRSRAGTPVVLGRADHESGWTIDWHTHGVLEGDRFYLLGDRRDATAGTWTWDADLVGTERRYTVIPGYLSRARFTFSGTGTAMVTLAGVADIMPRITNVTLHGGAQLENLGPFWGITSGLTTVLNPFWGDLSLPHVTFTKSGADMTMHFRGTHPQNGSITDENVAVTLVDVEWERQ